MQFMEYERTYLAKNIPTDLSDSPRREILDIYFPEDAVHPTLRFRKSDDKFTITKKWPTGEDHSEHLEQNIDITQIEFEKFGVLSQRRIHKYRYYYLYKDKTAEVDVFLDKLMGLVVVDVEFNSADELITYLMPDFCLIDVTQDEWLAGGILSGKAYSDIEKILSGYHYQKLHI